MSPAASDPRSTAIQRPVSTSQPTAPAVFLIALDGIEHRPEIPCDLRNGQDLHAASISASRSVRFRNERTIANFARGSTAFEGKLSA